MIGAIDGRIDSMIEKHEKDFITAYRGHMLKIAKEMEHLKKKCNEQEFLLRRDERVNSLEKQLEWFRAESLNLSKSAEQLKIEAERYKN